VIYKKEGTPWCDERFIGYGANKAACLYEIFISGVDFWVLPNDFLIHQSHKYAEHDRTREVNRGDETKKWKKKIFYLTFPMFHSVFTIAIYMITLEPKSV
jgi:hypothetical protein